MILITVDYCKTKCIDKYSDNDYYDLNKEHIEFTANTGDVGDTLDHFWVRILVVTVMAKYNICRVSWN